MWKDARSGRTLFTAEKAPLDGVVSSPLGRAEKLSPNREVAETGRIVRDLRIPNEESPKERHPAATTPEHAELAFRVVELKLTYPGIKVWMTKRDIEGAFKRVWLALDEVEIFAADIPAMKLLEMAWEEAQKDPEVMKEMRCV